MERHGLQTRSDPDARPARVGHAGTSDRIGAILEETRRIEEEIEVLEGARPSLEAKLDAATRPLIDAVIQTRRELVLVTERRILSAGPRERRFVREATELLRHLAADLEDRFGVRIRSALLDADMEEEFDEEDGAWDHDAWERVAKPQERASPIHRPRRAAPVDPEAAARGIYRNLARELHPDKTRDEEERIRRTELMQSLTTAWRERDLPALLRLLHAHGSDEARAGSLDDATLKATLQGMEETRDRLRRRLQELRHQGLPGGAVDWLLLVRDPKLFERTLRREKRIPREELEQMLRIKALFARPGGIEEFLDEVPWEDWPSVL